MEAVWIARMMARELDTLRQEIEAVADEAVLWTTPPGIGNSIGTLALHLAGNLQHFVGAVLGKTGYRRQRDLEFAARGVPRAELLAGLEQARIVVLEVLGSGKVDLGADYPEAVGGKFRVVTGDWLIHLEAHLAYHVGQAGYLRRVLTGGSAVPAVGIGALATARRVDG